MQAVLLLTRASPRDASTAQVFIPCYTDQDGEWLGLQGVQIAHSAHPIPALVGMAWDRLGLDLGRQRPIDRFTIFGLTVYTCHLAIRFDPPWKGWVELHAVAESDQYDTVTRLVARKLIWLTA